MNQDGFDFDNNEPITWHGPALVLGAYAVAALIAWSFG